MIARTHDLASITALGIALLIVPAHPVTLSTLIFAIIANLVGGILPDIDQPTAPFWRNLPIGSIFGKVFSKMSGGHRFITHSALGVLVIGYLFYVLLIFLSPIASSVDVMIVWWAFMIGIISHLILDTFNKEGVPWLLPIPIKFGFLPIKALRVEVDSWVENWLIFPGLLLINCCMYLVNYQQVLLILHSVIK